MVVSKKVGTEEVAPETPDYQVEDLGGAPVAGEPPHPADSYAGRASSFNGVVDNRMIPDAGMPTEVITGVLDTGAEGHGVLRPKFRPSDHDVYISSSQIRRFGLRPGDMVSGPARRPKEGERYWGLLKIDKVNDRAPVDLNRRARFEDLTAIFPKEQIKLETGKDPMSNRVIDLVAPIGRGQRGMIVSPPKAGKTTILKEIAAGVAQNFPKAHLMAALIGERPEEVTDIAQSVKGDVVASNFDEPPDNQTRVAEITLEK